MATGAVAVGRARPARPAAAGRCAGAPRRPAMSSVPKPSRAAESWLPLMRTMGVPRRRDAAERLAEQLDRLDRRDGPVVEVAGHEDDVDRLGAHHVDQEVDERGLALEERLAVQRAAEMPVAGVEDPHAPKLERGCDTLGDALGPLGSREDSPWRVTPPL